MDLIYIYKNVRSLHIGGYQANDISTDFTSFGW